MEYQLIGISGKAQSGKSTIANLICEHYNFCGIAFADKIKRIICDIYGLDEEPVFGPSERRNEPDRRYLYKAKGRDGQIVKHINNHTSLYEYNPLEDTYLSARIALIKLGEAGRNCCDYTWIHYLYEQVNKIIGGAFYNPRQGVFYDPYTASNYKGIVIPDIRRQNEFNSVKERGGYLIRVKRKISGLEGELAKDCTERDQDEIPDSDFNLLFYNDMPIENLPEDLFKILNSIIQ